MAATAVVCAVVTMAAPGAAYALADDPDAAPPRSGRADPPAAERPRISPERNRELEAVHRKVTRLYRKAEVATEAYDAAREASRKQSREIARIDKRADAARKRMSALRAQAGSMVRAQYRRAGLPPEMRMMLRSDPDFFFRDAGLVYKGQHATENLMADLARTQRTLDGYARSANARWRHLEESRKKKDAARKAVKKQLKAADALEEKLADEERARLRAIEDESAGRAQAVWLESGILDEIDGKASARGRRALAFATAQLGKDYEWGAEGPSTYDCSGLTSQAWQAAGRPIPRTSQEQWRRLPRIAVKDMRPGDLIIYHGDASHVGMYIGGGSIIHAPRPGRQVTVAGVGSMRILGVVRPDR